MQLQPRAAHQGRDTSLFGEDLRAAIIHQVRRADDGVRPPGLVGHRLHPARFIDHAVGRPVRLHIDRLRDPCQFDIGAVLADRVVAPDRLIRAEDARHHHHEGARHRPIVDAIASGDVEHACRVSREHQEYFARLPVPAGTPESAGV